VWSDFVNNLREKKKQETNKKIITTAREIFLSQGYEKTTINQIARKAEIGVGTFYNYYSSKSEIFLAIFFAKPQELTKRVEYIIENPGENFVNAVIKLCEVFIEPLNNIDINLWREIIAVFAGDINNHKNTMKDFVDIDFQMLEKVSELVLNFQKRGFISDKINPLDIAEIIYGIFATQMLMGLFDDSYDFSIMKENFYRQVRLFFADKLIK
jgi:AcrR family transcriptional regulator